MTGPAKIAWNITLWMALMVLPLWAQAAAPRDAVRNMPLFQHRSTFDIISSDQPSNHSYEETYRDYWVVDWETPQLDLGSGAWTTFDIHYATILTDALRRMHGTSSDSRFEQLTAGLRLNTSRDFEMSFTLDQQDTFSGQTPSIQPRAWNSKTSKNAYAAWSRGGFPRLTAGYASSNTYNYLGRNQNVGSESGVSQFQSEYRWQTNQDWQSLTILRQMTRTNTFLPEPGGSNRDKTIYDAQRQMRFPQFGTLSLGFHHEEESKDSTVGSFATNYSTNYSLGLQGSVRDMPVDYNYRYLAMYSGNSNSEGNQRMQRQFNLSFQPPVPPGKSAGLNYMHTIDESTYPNNEQTISEQQLNWSFKANPRTNTSFNYSLRQITDRLTATQTEDREAIGANIRYSIPGGRGSITGAINEEVARNPSRDQHNIVDSFNLGSSFILGPGTRLDLLFNQRKDENRSGLLGLPGGKDEFLSRVTYSTSGRGLALEASYEQRHYKLIPSDKATNQESINLTFTYQTEARWKYILKLISNARSVDSLAGTGYDYTTDDVIHAEVAYSF